MGIERRIRAAVLWPDRIEAGVRMEPITDEISRRLGVAFERWNQLENGSAREVENAELGDVGLELAAAIQSVTIDWPSQPPAAVLFTFHSQLGKRVKHLALVARALRGFQRGGTVSHDITPLHFQGSRGRGLFRMHITQPVEGWATYIHMRDRELKKAGKTGDGESFGGRMRSTYGCIRKVIAAGPPYLGDPFKRRAPSTILSGKQLQLWVKSQPTHQAAKDEEDILNEFYRGEWSKEGWKNGVRRHDWPAELNEKRARLAP